MLNQTLHPAQLGGHGGAPLSTEGMNMTFPARLGLCPESPIGRTLQANGDRPQRFTAVGESEFGETLRLNSSTGDLSKTLRKMRREYDCRLLRTQDIGASSLNKHTRTSHVAAMPKRLKSEDAMIRLRATTDCGLMGAGAGALAPWVADNLGDRDAAVRRRAVWTLKRMSMPVIQPHLGSVAQKLRHKDADVRALSAQLLGNMSYGADPHCYELSLCLKDSNTRVRQEAVEALAKIGTSGATPYVDDIAKCLQDEDKDIRRWACTALGKIGKAAKHHVEDVVLLLRDSDFRVRQAATVCLQDMRRL